MEHRFLDSEMEAWDFANAALGPLPPFFVIPNDPVPWPLAPYPVLAESSPIRQDYVPQLLTTPPWGLPSGSEQYGLLTGAQSTLPVSGPPRPGCEPRATQTTPETPAEMSEMADDTALLQVAVTQPAVAGVTPQDPDACERAPASGRRRPPVAVWWRQPRVYWGRRPWIAPAVFYLIWACCRIFLEAV